MTVTKILSELSRMSFLTLKKSGFTYGSQGCLLARNLENAWFQHCVTKPAHNVFLTSSDQATEATSYLKNVGGDVAPFALVALEHSKLKCNSEMFFEGEGCGINQKTAKVIVFNEGNSSKIAFQAIQRERKVWWRKLACQPSRFVLSEVKKSKGGEVVDILARFPFGDLTVESIKFCHDTQKFFPKVNVPFRLTNFYSNFR